MTDPVLAKRARIARWVQLGQRVGYGLLVLAVVLFFVALLTEFSGVLAGLIIAAVIVGSIVLAPAIVFGYAVKAADREDREQGRI